jgi:hypothetical protein
MPDPDCFTCGILAALGDLVRQLLALSGLSETCSSWSAFGVKLTWTIVWHRIP